MNMIDGFTRVFENAYFILDSDVKDCENYGELNFLMKTTDHNLIVELINCFAKNYNVDLLGLYKDYVKKCDNSFSERIIDFINEDL